MTALGVIVGRGQSKRLPGKMLREIGGHPLIGWTVRAAAAASTLDRVIVSTDSPEIAAAAEAYGTKAPFLRPAELATDTVGNDKVITHALDWASADSGVAYDIVVLIQPTAPFLQAGDIDACVARVADGGFVSAFTARVVEFPPEWMFRGEPGKGVQPLLEGPWFDKDRKVRALPTTYRANGAVWATRVDAFRSSGSVYNAPMDAVMMSAERSVDIDYEWDLAEAQATLQANGFSITA
jgi:CMP-N,N'-diacetyllegionaminic acid synthase